MNSRIIQLIELHLIPASRGRTQKVTERYYNPLCVHRHQLGRKAGVLLTVLAPHYSLSQAPPPQLIGPDYRTPDKAAAKSNKRFYHPQLHPLPHMALLPCLTPPP